MKLFLPLYIKPVYTLVVGLLLTLALLYYCSHKDSKPTEASGVAGVFTPLTCM